MAEDRMLNDEILLGLIKANSGGGGGTTDYEDLNNLPKINSVELKGDKSLADLGIASASAVSDILNGTDIDSFGDVEKALAGKADLTDLAPAFSTETAYAVGKYVSYGGNIYKCTSAHSAGAWAAGDFTLVAVGSELETKQDILTFDDTPTDGSNNPVKSNGIYDALATKTNTDMVAADFNAGTSYTAGNYCVQDGKLYKFKNNHSGAWSSADVDEVKITGELSALRSGLIFGLWIPANEFDPLTQCNGFYCYSVNPGLKILQGAPNNYSEYATIFGCSGVTYKILMYVDVFGSFAVWSTRDNGWISYRSF